MKLLISKNKEGNGYYTKIQNDYNGVHTEKFLSIQTPKNMELEYGLYEVDGFFSTYQKRNGEVELKFIITTAAKIQKNNNQRKEQITNPYKDMKTKVENDIGEQIKITPEDFPF